MRDFKGKIILVAGGGYFGSVAVESLKNMKAKVIVVDINRSCKASKHVNKILKSPTIANPNNGEAYLIVYDSVKYLIEMVKNNIIPNIIVPAIPGHFIGKFLKSYLEAKGFNVTPDSKSISIILGSKMLNDVILDVNISEGVIVVSYMPKGLKCKIPCIQPEVCPVTGRAKKTPMYLLLESAINGVSYPKIFQSHLISQNVGGIQGSSIPKLLNEIINGNKLKIAVGTACKCHGIINFFNIHRKPTINSKFKNFDNSK